MPVHSLGYVRVESPNLDAWSRFGTGVLGLMLSSDEDRSLTFRIDDYPARLVVREASAPRLAALGLEVRNRRDLEMAVAAVEHAGIKVRHGSVEEAAERNVSAFAQFNDPGETPIEIFYGPVLDHVSLVTPLVSGFVTADMGMGHAVIANPAADACFEFYTGVLGFEERNTFTRANGTTLWFVSPNARHHTLAFAQADDEDVHLVHIMLEVAAIDDVGRALDRVLAGAAPLQTTLGRHTNDGMLSFYMQTPDGFDVEYGWGGKRIEPGATTYEITSPSLWGHKVLRHG